MVHTQRTLNLQLRVDRNNLRNGSCKGSKDRNIHVQGTESTGMNNVTGLLWLGVVFKLE